MMKQKAVAEWKAAEERRLAAERHAKEQRDREFKERLKQEFGYGEDELQGLVTKSKGPTEEELKKQEEELKKKIEEEKKKEEEKKDEEDKKEKDRRTTWIKVCQYHLLPVYLLNCEQV